MAKRHETQRGVTHKQDDSRSSKDKEATITMKPSRRFKPIIGRMSDGPVDAASPLKEAESSVSERADVDTTRRRSGTCYVTTYGSVHDGVTTSTSKTTR